MEAFTQVSHRDMGGQAVCPKRGQCVKVWDWNEKCSKDPKKFRDARNMEHLRKATRNEQSQPKKEAVRTAITSSALEVGPPKPLGVHISPQLALGAGHRTTRFNVYPLDFSFALVPWITISCSSVLEWEFLSWSCCMSAVFSFLFDFCRDSQLRVCFESERRLWTWTFEWTVKTLVTLRDGLSIFCLKRCTWVFWGPEVECHGLGLKCPKSLICLEGDWNIGAL